MGAKVREKPVGSGNWYVFIDHEGKRKAHKCKNKKIADTWANKINMEIAAKNFNLMPKEKAKTFGYYAEVYLSHATVKPATADTYASTIALHVLPEFGKRQVSEITKLDIKNFLRKKLKTGLSMSSIVNMKACISNIMNCAVDDGTVPHNPAANLGGIGGRGQEAHKPGSKKRYLNREELAKLLDTFRKHDPDHYLFCLLLSRSGMRVGEACSLQWTDLDFENRTIAVRRGKSRTKIDLTKSGKERKVDMSQQLCDELKKERLKMLSESVRSGKRIKWIFPGELSETKDPTSWRKHHFDPMLKVAGLGKMRVHDLRHTYASLMLDSGQSLKYLQAQLGHHSIKMTADTYAHLIPSNDRGAADALDDIMEQSVK